MTPHARRAAYLALAFFCAALLAACARHGRSLPPGADQAPPSPRQLDKLAEQAEDYLKEGSCVRAAHSFNALLEYDPGRVESMAGLAAANWCREDYRKSAKAMDDAMRRTGDGATARIAQVMAALELTAAKRQARMALRMEDRLPPPVRDSVALVGAMDAHGLSGPRESAVSHLLGKALDRAGLGLADQALVAALKRELTGDSPALSRETARRVARLTGAYYALTIQISETGPMTATLLPVLPASKRMELLDRTRTRMAGRLRQEQEREATLQKRLLAVKRGLDYFKAKERIPALLVEKDVLCKKVSQLLKTGRVDEARESLAEIQELDREMASANKQIKNFKRELFELELNVFNVTPAYLQEEGPRLQQDMAQSRRTQENLQEALRALGLRRTHMIPDSGAALELAALCSPVPMWQDMAAERVLLRVRPETRPDPRLSAAALSCSGEMPQIERERLDALGRGIQARNSGDYRLAHEHFARCPELAPPGLPPEGLSPMDMADAPPSHAALMAYNMLVSAVRGQGGS